VAYEPLKTFTYLAAPFLLVGVLLLGRAIFVYIMRQLINDYPQDNFQSLVGGGVALLLGFLIFLFGILADRIGGIRRLLDEVLYRARSREVADEEWRREVSARLDQLDRTLLEDGLAIEPKDSVRERG
jgi:hypothetical protein